MECLAAGAPVDRSEFSSSPGRGLHPIPSFLLQSVKPITRHLSPSYSSFYLLGFTIVTQNPLACVDGDTESCALSFIRRAVGTLYLVIDRICCPVCGLNDTKSFAEHTLLWRSMQGGLHHARLRLVDKLVRCSAALSFYDHCLAGPGFSCQARTPSVSDKDRPVTSGWGGLSFLAGSLS